MGNSDQLHGLGLHGPDRTDRHRHGDPVGRQYLDAVQLTSCRVSRPDRPDCVLLAITLGDRRAGRVGVVPPFAVQPRSQGATAGHLEMAIGVRLTHPIPGVTKPGVAILRALVRKPGDLVITPDPDAAGPGLPRLPADAP